MDLVPKARLWRLHLGSGGGESQVEVQRSDSSLGLAGAWRLWVSGVGGIWGGGRGLWEYGWQPVGLCDPATRWPLQQTSVSSPLLHEFSLKCTSQKTHGPQTQVGTAQLHPAAADSLCPGTETAPFLGPQGPNQSPPAGCRGEAGCTVAAGWGPSNWLRGLAGLARQTRCLTG